MSAAELGAQRDARTAQGLPTVSGRQSHVIIQKIKQQAGVSITSANACRASDRPASDTRGTPPRAKMRMDPTGAFYKFLGQWARP